MVEELVQRGSGVGNPDQRGQASPPTRRLSEIWVGMVIACAVLGFLLVAQVRTTEGLRDRLETEREEDLARLLADLSRESDRLQSELTELHLDLAAVENSAQSEELALTSLQQRLDDLGILAGIMPAQGQGVELVVTDPDRLLMQDQLVDTVQELRDAGAEAIAVNGVRLVASSAFTTRQGRLLADGHPLKVPYRITAIGPGETMAKALQIPGGAIDTLESVPAVKAAVHTRDRLQVPARPKPPSFRYGRPAHAEQAGIAAPGG